jgi:ABC-type transporter Mla MlaB component
MSDRFELPAELNIYGALEIRDALLAWVTENTAKGGDYLEISARDVAEVDGSGLQLLASLSNMGQSWRLAEASTVFSDACRTLGFADWLDGRHSHSKSSGAAK